MVGVRIFWVGWGLMQHHDWEASGCLLLFCATWCLGDWEGSVPRCRGSRERGSDPFQVGFQRVEWSFGRGNGESGENLTTKKP